jgi:hypothetical protein
MSEPLESFFGHFWFEAKRHSLCFVIRCRLGYYGPDPSARGHNLGDLPIEKAYRYTKRGARELAENLGADVEELKTWA